MFVRVFRICAALALLCALFPLAAMPAQADEPDYDGDTAIVGVKSKDKDKAKEAVEELGGEVEEVSASGYFMVVETPEDSKDWAAKLKGDNRVKYVEPDWEVTADVTPTDPSYGQLWAMPKISMPAAWDVEDGSSSVVVGVIDSGIDYTHEDLEDQMWTHGEVAGNGIDDDGNGWVDDVHGWDCRNNDGNPIDDNDHGTHVAGTIGAEANNGVGVAGVNWDVSLMALKFLGSTGSGSTSDAAECLHYAIDNGANITNNSWGGGGFSQTMLDAIRRARDNDQLFIASAGNSATNNDSTPHYPSSYDSSNIISVANTGTSDSLSSTSSYGATTVDLAAPGSSILSTVRNDAYSTKSGTSMASPHVTGAAALMMAEHSFYKDDYSALRSRILDSVDPVAALSGKVATGGRLNVARALELPDDPPTVSLADPGAVVTGTVGLSATASDDNGVTKVDFFANNTLIGTDTTSGYTATWETASGAWPDGVYTVKAVATDTKGQTATSNRTVSVDNVDSVPTVSITSPANNADVAGTVNVLANAADDRDTISSVALLVNGDPYGAPDTNGTDGWSVSWNTLAHNDGAVTLAAKATTSTGQVNTSVPVTVNVDNVRTIHVHDLDGTKTALSGRWWRATATVEVRDEQERLMTGVTVRINWSRGTSPVTCTTTSTGRCSVNSSQLDRKSSASITATVASLTLSGYSAGTNHDVDGGTNGTVVTITRP